MEEATIFALASGGVRAGIAVLRLSGPQADGALQALTKRPLPPPRLAAWRRLLDPRTGEVLDEALVLRFLGPSSFTGQDVVELHTHGSRAVVAALIEVLASLPGLRPAEAGEFSRRAFENGKLDLTAAEGLADLIEAETAAQRRQALRQMDGALARLYDGWREALVGLLSLVEAEIDFPDEDLPEGLREQARQGMAGLLGELRGHLADQGRGERLREGIEIVLLGPPNAGKSSLLNRLARRDAAIVSATAGTTRDVIEIHLDLGGYPVILADTAGLRDSAEAIEVEGVRRALARAERADLKLVVFDAATWPELDEAARGQIDHDTLVLLNKVDHTDPGPVTIGGQAAWPVSAASGEGLEALLAELSRRVESRFAATEAPSLTRTRHRQALEEAAASLERALGADLPELAGEELRLAGRALGRITGRIEVEEILDRVFGQFCIGK